MLRLPRRADPALIHQLVLWLVHLANRPFWTPFGWASLPLKVPEFRAFAKR